MEKSMSFSMLSILSSFPGGKAGRKLQGSGSGGLKVGKEDGSHEEEVIKREGIGLESSGEEAQEIW